MVGIILVGYERGYGMKISTKGRYGLRAAIDIAIFGVDQPVALSEIAVRQNISISYLEQLIAKLKKANIVTSIRGAQGGYQLAQSPDKISVGDILRALEGDLNPVDCAAITGEGETCDGSKVCVTKLVWKKISDSINDTVDHIMMSELLEESHHLNDENDPEATTIHNECNI